MEKPFLDPLYPHCPFVNLGNSVVQYCGNCCLNKVLEGSDLLSVGNVAAAHEEHLRDVRM